jgi:ribosomal protein S27E
MTTKSDDATPAADRVTSARCPVCLQNTTLHAESIRVGTEVLCRECSAVLRVEATSPLTLSEVEEEDLL